MEQILTKDRYQELTKEFLININEDIKAIDTCIKEYPFLVGKRLAYPMEKSEQEDTKLAGDLLKLKEILCSFASNNQFNTQSSFDTYNRDRLMFALQPGDKFHTWYNEKTKVRTLTPQFMPVFKCLREKIVSEINEYLQTQELDFENIEADKLLILEFTPTFKIYPTVDDKYPKRLKQFVIDTINKYFSKFRD